MSGIFQILLVAGASLSILIVDRFGRKPLLISGFVLLTCILACFVAFSAMFQNTQDPSTIPRVNGSDAV
jgi:MFS family permease